LQQRDLTPESCEEAFTEYLVTLDVVARLEVASLYRE